MMPLCSHVWILFKGRLTQNRMAGTQVMQQFYTVTCKNWHGYLIYTVWLKLPELQDRA